MFKVSKYYFNFPFYLTFEIKLVFTGLKEKGFHSKGSLLVISPDYSPLMIPPLDLQNCLFLMFHSISTIAESMNILSSILGVTSLPKLTSPRGLDPDKRGHAADAQNGNGEEKILYHHFS